MKKPTIVYAYVCGDILHEGHLIQLENAKAMGDKLIVGVLTDKAVMEKKEKPVLSLQERMRLVRALECVDAVIPQDEYSPLRNVKGIRPDIMMESESHKEQPANKFVESYGGRVLSTPYFPEQSSTRIKKNVRKR